MRYELFASYGVLAHEKKPVFSDGIPASDFYDVITVDIPDNYSVSKNNFGDTLIDINGTTYMLREVLSNYGTDPCLQWYDGQKMNRVILRKL